MGLSEFHHKCILNELIMGGGAGGVGRCPLFCNVFQPKSFPNIYSFIQVRGICPLYFLLKCFYVFRRTSELAEVVWTSGIAFTIPSRTLTYYNMDLIKVKYKNILVQNCSVQAGDFT